MGCVFKKVTTRALPADAEISVQAGKRIAKWSRKGGKPKTAAVTPDGRIRVESTTWFVKYRDGAGRLVVAPTGCRDKAAARQVLADLERKSQRVRSGLMTKAEAATAEGLNAPIAEHVDAYAEHLESDGVTSKHIRESRRILRSILDGCDFKTLAALDRTAFERWLNRRRTDGASARTRNADRETLLAFCNWLAHADVGRLAINPFKAVAKADEKADRRRQRRALAPAELDRLLDAAARRPLFDAMAIRRGIRKGLATANVRPETREQLARLGRERALIYKTLATTGLRVNELRTLVVGRLDLDGPRAFLTLDAKNEKNRQGNAVAVRADVTGEIRDWLTDKLSDRQATASRAGEPIPSRLDPAEPVFGVPTGLVRILNRDLAFAGLAKRDDRNRVVDVHSLRVTFGTLLARAGVPLRTAQAAMRHCDPRLTANVYTDPQLLDVSGAIESLPTFKRAAEPDAVRKAD